MTIPIFMPARGEPIAPTFDKTKPRKLPQFFDDLEDLFNRALVTDNTKKKRHILRYIDYDLELLWKAIPEYSDNTKTYSDFKNAIISFYPEAADSMYSLANMDFLIAKRLRFGIATMTNLSEFHLQFSSITSWLISNGQLDEIEQRQAYIRAFHPQFLAAILNRLQWKNSDHHPSIPHPVKDVYDAALYVLRSSLSATRDHVAPPIATSLPLAMTASAPEMEHKDITEIFSKLTKTVLNAISQDPSSHQPCDQNQLTAASLLHMAIQKPDSHVQQAKHDRTSASIGQSQSQSSTKHRIASLEAEILALRTRKSATSSFSQNHTLAPKDTRVRFSDHNQVAPIVVTRDKNQVQPRSSGTIHISTSQPNPPSEQPITVAQRDLPPLAPESRSQACHITTSHRLLLNKQYSLKSLTIAAPFRALKSPSLPSPLSLFSAPIPSSIAPEISQPLRTISDTFSLTRSLIYPPGLAIPIVPKIIAPPSSICTSQSPIASSTPSPTPPKILPSYRAPSVLLTSIPSSIPPSDIAVQTVSNIVILNSPILSPATSFLVSRSTNNLATPEPVVPRICDLSASISTDYTSPNASSLRQREKSQFRHSSSLFIIYNFVPPLRRLTTRHKDISNVALDCLDHSPTIDPEPPPFDRDL